VLLVTIDTFAPIGSEPASRRRSIASRLRPPVHVRAHRGAADAAVARDDSHRAAAAHGVRKRRRRARRHHPTLARLLKNAGYDTAAFVGAFVLDHRFGLARFDVYDDQIRAIPTPPSASKPSAWRRRSSIARWRGSITANPQSAIRNPQCSCGSIIRPPRSLQPPKDRPPGWSPADGEIATPTRSWHASSMRLARQLLDHTIVVVADHGEDSAIMGNGPTGCWHDSRCACADHRGASGRRTREEPVSLVDLARRCCARPASRRRRR
jgi:hypothetical protein